MIEDLLNFLLGHYSIVAYLVALIFSILFYRKYFDTELKYFPILIGYTFFNELLGYFVRYTDGFSFFSKKELLSANDLIYNIYEIIFYSFFFYIYWSLAKQRRHKTIIVCFFTIIVLSYVINSLFENPIHVLLYWASAIASIMLFITSILHLQELRKMQKWEIRKYNLMFWVSLSIAIFYFFFPILSIIGFKNYELWQQLHLRTVLRILIVIMYSLFIIGFLWSRRRAFR